MTGIRRRGSLVAVLAAALALVATAAACSAQTAGGAGETSGSDGANAPGSATASGSATTSGAAKASDSGAAKGAALAASGPDIKRVLKVLAYMRAVPPAKPVVVLLGGSGARESTSDDADWREQIVGAGGPATLAWNLGSRNRTMGENLAIVEALPEGADVLVYIGVNVGSFSFPPKTVSLKLPSPAPTKAPSLRQPHQYSSSRIYTPAKKEALVAKWVAERQPVFDRHFGASARALENVVKLCRSRGYYPVLLELPQNTAAIGSSFSEPNTTYRDKCRTLAEKYDVPWVPLLASELPDGDFYDLWHLVESGREVWQARLSANAAKILNSEAFQGSGS